jgi:hypothetical protein
MLSRSAHFLRWALAALLLGLGTALPFLAPQPARAYHTPEITFGPGCLYMNEGHVTGTTQLHSYGYTLSGCDPLPGVGEGARLTAEGAYNVQTREAAERLRSSDGRLLLRSTWSCSRDPWITSVGDFSCRHVATTSNVEGWPLGGLPSSVWVMHERHQQYLKAKLDEALRAPPPPPPPPPLSAKLPPIDQAPGPIASRILAAPTNFLAKRDQSGLFIELTWADNAIGEGYYEIRAFNHQSGQPIPRLTVPANTTRYIDRDNTSQVGGVDYELRACLGADCSAPAKATFLK